MPNNLPPLSQSPATSASPVRGELVSSLSRLLGVARGTSVPASVEIVTPATPAQRNVLLSQNNAHLAVLNPISNSPSIKLQIDKLMEQQTLLKSPALTLAQLQVSGKSLLTYTTQPLQVGQTVEVKLDARQRLVQLAVIPTAPTLASQLVDQTISANPARTAQTQTLLAALMRNLLPQKDAPQELLAALPKTQDLPPQQRNQLLSASVQQALKTLADQLSSPEQLANPKRLTEILKNSGVQFEHKLASKLVANPGQLNISSKYSPVGNASSASTGSLAPANLSTSSLVNSPTSLPINTSTGSSTHSPISPLMQSATTTGAANPLVTQDVKGALLQLLQRVRQDLGRELPALPPQAEPQSVAQKPAIPGYTTALSSLPLLAQTIPQPFGNLTQLMNHIHTRPQAELSDKVLRTQLLLLLHQHTLGSLAKIQLQQLHTLNHQQAQADTAQPTQSWLFDIPVKLGQEINQLEMRIDEEWVADDKDPNQRDKKTRQWSVMLSFDLPQHGGFYAQLTLVNDSVSAKLWADQETTLLQAQQKLEALRQQLQSQGVEVKQLQCLKGAPPHRSISLNYALVDITT